MQRRWRRWCRALALGALGFLMLSPAAGRAEDSGGQPGQMRVIKIAEAVVIVDEAGNTIMYEDPTQQEANCDGLSDCWGFSAGSTADIVISNSGNIVQGIDLGSGRMFEERVLPSISEGGLHF
jgi:hypothetical protein